MSKHLPLMKCKPTCLISSSFVPFIVKTGESKHKVVCVCTVKAYRGWRGTVALILNLSARWKWTVGHFTVSKITPSIHWIRRVGRPQSHTGGLGEERVSCPCLGSNPRLSSHYIDYTILTPYFYIKTNKQTYFMLCKVSDI